MKYNNENVRRSDRLMDEERATELLRTSEYGILSMVADESGYGIPINYVWDGADSLYLHCAPEGRKLQALESNPRVSFCIVGKVNLLPSKFTTEYESIILKGVAHTHLSEEERMDALHLIIDKFSADYKDIGDKYAHKSFHRVKIIRLDISEMSGKRKSVKPNEAGFRNI
ncbi:pyridoxamine 5'-phosphate oxidase family protein [Prevotella ihumii]|uniref:pyridoxamine 5'-phosphate oxidase family protein n=1 Tax=Prevotella ihumii TaxID=1917878 RepID=UPI000982658F|nr:pyridoxamine 5'-phosphate oxidase family protein [Prevotella ihumii]